MNEQLFNELRIAMLSASAGAMGDAERHVHGALQLVDSAPRDSLPRIVRGHIGEAGFAIKQGNSRVAASELEEASLSLGEPISRG